jgi:hypothetical protein
MPPNDKTDRTHRVSETADKIKLKTKLVRGSGTRDQDKITVVIKDSDPEDAVTKLNQTLAMLETTADSLRKVQPGSNSE